MAYKMVRASSNDQIEEAYKVRREVFINEQGVPENLEFDRFDSYAKHYVVYDGDEVIGTVRILYGSVFAKIQRFAVVSSKRQNGVGRYMMQYVLDILKQEGQKMIILDAQVRVEEFYRKFGFVRMGSEFMDAGIPHVKMCLKF